MVAVTASLAELPLSFLLDQSRRDNLITYAPLKWSTSKHLAGELLLTLQLFNGPELDQNSEELKSDQLNFSSDEENKTAASDLKEHNKCIVEYLKETDKQM